MRFCLLGWYVRFVILNVGELYTTYLEFSRGGGHEDIYTARYYCCTQVIHIRLYLRKLSSHLATENVKTIYSFLYGRIMLFTFKFCIALL